MLVMDNYVVVKDSLVGDAATFVEHTEVLVSNQVSAGMWLVALKNKLNLNGVFTSEVAGVPVEYY